MDRYFAESRKTDSGVCKVAYRIVFYGGTPVSVEGGLFGGGWCASLEEACRVAGIGVADVCQVLGVAGKGQSGIE